MNGLCPGRQRRRDDGIAAQIAFGHRRRPDPHRLIRHLHMQGLRIGIRINRNAAHVQLARGGDDTAGNLAPIGDKDLAKHHHILNTPKRVSSIGAFRQTDSDNASTARLLRGSMIPSSHNRAEA